MKLKLLLSTFWIAVSLISAHAQSGVAISESSNRKADASAILDVVSTSKGMLVPRMTNSQRNGISSPATGLLIYQIDNTPGFYYYNGSAWQGIGGGGSVGAETDPQVSSTLTDAIPVWNGTSLVDGSLEDDGSKVGVFTGGGSEKMRFTSLPEGQGYILIYGPSLSPNVSISSLESNADNGYLTVHDDQGNSKAGIFVGASSTGTLFTEGENGNLNVALDHLSDNTNNGFIAVYDENGSQQAGMYVDGNGQGYLFGDVVSTGIKNFTVPHPTDNTKEIWYASLEGPEAAMYIRGTSALVNGEARIELPEHFSLLASEKSITVIATPLSASSNGLAIIEKSPTHFVVKELMNGTGSYQFDWEIKSVRKDFEDYEVVRNKIQLEERSSNIKEAKGKSIKADSKQ